jgi:hypothetical protein
MPSSRVAEWILALFLTREQSAAVVGDLIECMPARGGLLWFWSSVLRTAFSLLWAGLRAEPAFMVWLGCRAAVLSVFLFAACIVMFIFCLALASGFFPLAARTAASRETLTLRILIGLPFLGAMSAVQFQTGRWVARRARGREVAACAAFSVVQLAAGALLGALLVATVGESAPAQEPRDLLQSISAFIGPPLWYGSAFWGAIRIRNRAVQRWKHRIFDL